MSPFDTPRPTRPNTFKQKGSDDMCAAGDAAEACHHPCAYPRRDLEDDALAA
jgi:hypothetical protein